MGKTVKRITETPRKRKVSSGPIREKARTMDRLISAVGRVIEKKGYVGLNVAAVSKEAGLDRRLVYTYFGSLDSLVEIYVKQKDYWNSDAKDSIISILEGNAHLKSEDIICLLQGQFDAVLNDRALQKIIHWELGERHHILRKLSDSRELLGEELFKSVDSVFVGTDVDIRAVIALQIGGLYYLSLHAKSNGSLFCGIDINQSGGKKRISTALAKVIALCYTQVK